MYFEAQILTRRFFFTVSAKVLNKVVVGSGQNKNLLWECDHWTKVRLRREKKVSYKTGLNILPKVYFSF